MTAVYSRQDRVLARAGCFLFRLRRLLSNALGRTALDTSNACDTAGRQKSAKSKRPAAPGDRDFEAMRQRGARSGIPRRSGNRTLLRSESSSAEGVHAATLYAYHPDGTPFLTALDLNTNGVIDLDGPDRVTGTSSAYEKDASNLWWRVSRQWVYPEFNSASAVTTSIQRTLLTNLGVSASTFPCVLCVPWLNGSHLVTSLSESIDVRGNSAFSAVFTDRAAKTVISAALSPASIQPAVEATVNGLLASTVSSTAVTNTFAYDGLGRRIAVTDGRGNTTVAAYNPVGQVLYTEDAAANRTSYAYDALGRRITVTDALGNVTHTAYDTDDRVTAQWGAAYPVAYEYDAQGRMVQMGTYRGAAEVTDYASFQSLVSSFDKTVWLYDQPTGLLTNKLYADGQGPAYTYTPDGKLATRLWARGIATAYIYDAAGSLAGVDYSDDTPDIAYTFDRLGRQLSAVSSVSTNLFSYSPDTLELFSETQNGVSLTRLTDDQGRPAGIALGDDYRIFYGYDVFGRFASASSSVSSVVNYSRLPGTDLLTGYTLSSPVSNFQFQVSKSYEPHRDLITSVSNLWGASVISAYDYANDVVGRRVSRRDSGLAFVQPQSNSFGYNPCSEITDAVMHTNIYGYVFDPVGNRLVSSHNTETNSYVSNPLNQYTVISNFVNSIQIKPTYDADGNMTTNGLWSYTWDGENRLISVSSNGAPIAHFVYDHQSRRIAKNTSVRTIEFLYDGWAMIREKTATSLDSPTVKNYCYGLDLSDRLPNVGTIGGIWLVWTNTKLEYYTYDANGNVSELINERGEIVKHYEYEPFGNTTMMGGHDIDTNSFRFSTKYFDADVGVYYYEYRFYLHIFGRFISRDPLGDEAFLKQLLRGKTWRKQSYWRNLALEPSYLFSKNASVFLTDHLGLMAWGFKYHGQWCGPGWTGGQEKNSEDYDWPNSSTTYADYLDNCCRQHDACYAGWDLSKGDWSSSKRPQLDCDDDLCQCSKGGPNPNSASALGIRCYFCVAKEDESKGICCRFVF